MYVTTRGLTTSPMPYQDVTEAFALEGPSITRFYEQMFSRLSQLGIEAAILDKPYDL